VTVQGRSGRADRYARIDDGERPPGKLGAQVIDIPHDVSGPFFASALAYATEKTASTLARVQFGEGPLTPADCDALLQPISTRDCGLDF
jgi:hypothetical protein